MLQVMSFNIRYALADDGPNRWELRKQQVIERIRVFQPDLLGMQECRDDAQAEYIRRELADWHFYGVPRGGGDQTALEMAPILFKKSAFKPLQQGCFWLSTTPHVPGSKSWGSHFARTATWARLQHLASGRRLVFLSTHFDLQPAAILESARLLKEWADQVVQQDALIITGDFNSDKNSAAYHCLTEDRTLADAYRCVQPAGSDEATFHAFGQAAPSTPIDWILVSPHFEVLSASIDRHQESGLYPSDHYPLGVQLRFQPQ